MLTASRWKNVAASATFLFVGALALTLESVATQAQSRSRPDMKARIDGLVPELERYLQDAMANGHVPGVAVGIVTGDQLHYAKGFGKRNDKGEPVDAKTVFQIGSVSKGFLATTMAIEVDKGRLRWDDRVVDVYPAFQLKDPWVTQEFRVFDLLAQRSGLPPYVNDSVAILGLPEDRVIHSLRFVEPVSSFRATYTYTNVTHLLAGRIVANKAGQPDWTHVLKQNLLEPLGMNDSSYTADAIRNAPNHADGHHWTPGGSNVVPFIDQVPYSLGGAGNINSTVEDMARWIRLQLGKGSFAGKQIVSADNLAVTRTPRVPFPDRVSSYANGWIILPTDNGTIVWHSGATEGFGGFVGLLPDKDVGIVILSNVKDSLEFATAFGIWALRKLLGSTLTDLLDSTRVDSDPLATQLRRATDRYEAEQKQFARPANPRPSPDPKTMIGKYSNPSFGEAVMSVADGAPVLELTTGARLRFAEWDGNVLTMTLSPEGRFKDLALDLGPFPPLGLAQWQVDQDGKYSLGLGLGDAAQSYEFRRRE
jgi:CubicO group peptidase (beta-lactamase class C family)